MDIMDVQLIQDEKTTRKLYRTRWYVLCCLSLMSCLQNIIWIGYGPIAQSAKAVFDWSNETVDMFVNYGNISCIVFILPACWIMDVKGLRISVIWSTIAVAIGTGLRCISYHPVIALWLVSIGQTINGVAGTVALAAPALLSETWFPLKERTTATAISLLFSSVGGAVAFVVGPQVVSEPKYTNISGTENNATYNSTLIISNISKMKTELSILNFTEFGVAAALAVLVCIYFPNTPPTPPSETAAIERTNFWDATKRIVKMGKFWHIAWMFAIPSGVYGCWGSVLDVNLKPFGISQKEAGWLDFYGSVGGITLGILLSRFSDIFMEKIKSFLLVMYSAAIVFFVMFALMCQGVIPFNTSILYFTCIAGSTLVGGAIPLFFELSCETTYPISEGLTTGFMTLALNVSGSVFLLLSLIPNIGTIWPNWTLIGSIVVSTFLLAIFTANYKRLEVDIMK